MEALNSVLYSWIISYMYSMYLDHIPLQLLLVLTLMPIESNVCMFLGIGTTTRAWTTYPRLRPQEKLVPLPQQIL